MFVRKLTPYLLNEASMFPVLVVVGPRQSGKTTLLRQAFPDYAYLSLESPDTLARLRDDPRGTFADLNKSWIIDEAQNDPELFSYLQELVDHPDRKGKFVLSGSQNFLLLEKISQSLAGRAAILELLPLSYPEFITEPEHSKIDVWDYLYHGSYPRPYHEKIDINLWYNSYIRTYLERDVRSLTNIHDLSTFQLFLKLCAGRHGQLLNLNSLAVECGISQPTAKTWLNILEASYIIFRLKPYYKNFNKRLVKTPKLYFYDTAIVCQLLGIESSQHLQIHSSRGAIFEGFILSEIIKNSYSQGKVPNLFFWRDSTGLEIDGLIETSEQLIAIEIKSTMTFTNSLLKNLHKWSKFVDIKTSKYLIYAGPEQFNYKDIAVLPWNKLEEL